MESATAPLTKKGGTSCQDVYSRCSDDNFCVDKLLIEFGIFTLLVRGRHESVTLVLQPFPNAKLVLGGTKQTWLLLCVLVAL